MSLLNCHVETEVCTATDVRRFHTRAEVSRNLANEFKRPLRESSEKYLAQVGPLGAEIVRGLMRIKGITTVWIHPYSLQVTRARAYTWDELEPRICTVITRAIINHPLEQLDGWVRIGFLVGRWWAKVKRSASNLVHRLCRKTEISGP